MNEETTNERSVTAAPIVPVEPASGPDGAATVEPEVKKSKTHQRAGFTTHKGQGAGKAHRKMAAKSRRINRRK